MNITDAETHIMRALWKTAPLSADEIIDRVAKGQNWTSGTARTLISRLLNKGVISAKSRDGRYYYAPEVAESQYISGESGKFMDRLFGGKVSNLVLHLAQEEKISDQDMAEILDIIKDLENAR